MQDLGRRLHEETDIFRILNRAAEGPLGPDAEAPEGAEAALGSVVATPELAFSPSDLGFGPAVAYPAENISASTAAAPESAPLPEPAETTRSRRTRTASPSPDLPSATQLVQAVVPGVAPVEGLPPLPDLPDLPGVDILPPLPSIRLPGVPGTPSTEDSSPSPSSPSDDSSSVRPPQWHLHCLHHAELCSFGTDVLHVA